MLDAQESSTAKQKQIRNVYIWPFKSTPILQQSLCPLSIEGKLTVRMSVVFVSDVQSCFLQLNSSSETTTFLPRADPEKLTHPFLKEHLHYCCSVRTKHITAWLLTKMTQLLF